MPAVRRFLGAVAAALVAIGMVAAPPPAVAQNADVTLRLESQSPWSSAAFRGALDLELTATNRGGTPLRNLQLVVQFGTQLSTQADFDAMLSSGVPAPVGTVTKSINGTIDAGTRRTIPMTVDLTTIDAIDQLDSQVYPASITLVADGTNVATLVTPVIYLARAPVEPMLSTVSVPLQAPIAFGADDSLVDTSFPGSLAHGGSIRAPLDAIAGSASTLHPRGVVDLLADPLVITQARDLADGYRTADGTQVASDDPPAKQAARFLGILSGVTADAKNVEMVAAPYGDPILPAMVHQLTDGTSLETQLIAQRTAGNQVLENLHPSLQPRPNPFIARPAAVDGVAQLNDGTLDWLAGTSTEIVLGDADTVDRSPWQGSLAPAPTVPTAAGPTLVLPDPTVQALFGRTDLLGDPVLASQLVLGELALIWKQEPVPVDPIQRGVAISPPATLPAPMWAPLLDRLASAPFLKPTSLSQLVRTVNPDNPNEAGPLTTQSTAEFDPNYAADIQRLSIDVQSINSMLGPGSPVPPDLRRRLFIATEPVYMSDTLAGRPWLGSVDAAARQAFAAVSPTMSDTFTFTSREGSIPMQMGNPGDNSYAVKVELASPSFSFPNGEIQDVTVDRPGVPVVFHVIANASGQSTLTLTVRAPNGTPIPNQNDNGATFTTITVRSTAVNRIALFVTLAAALGLIALYARRWFRRRTSPT
jgi:hypothetical protein